MRDIWHGWAISTLFGKPAGKCIVRRLGHRCLNNSKTYFKEVWCGDVNLVCLVQDRTPWRAYLSTVMD
jgi:hypothetical protein